MTTTSKLQLLADTINATAGLSGADFNQSPAALQAYKVVKGENALQDALLKKADLHLNPFYYPDALFEKVTKESNIDALEANVIADSIKNKYTRNWLKVFLVERAIAQNNLTAAETIISELPDEDSGPARYVGHRVLLRHFAQQGDIEEFRKRVKPAKPARFPKREVGSLKFQLLECYSKKHGTDKGMVLSGDKFFERVSPLATVRWAAHLITLDAIDALLDRYPVLLQEDPARRAELYVLHFKVQPEAVISGVEWKRVLAEVLKVDKGRKAGDLRLRDALLCDLGASTRNKDLVNECKKHMIAPKVKQELNGYLATLG